MKDEKELVRYSFIRGYVKTNSGFRKRRIIKEHELGEYVRYDQAAAMLAAKDAEIQELKENLGVVSTERHADAEYIGQLQDKLAQINAQEPVAYTLIFRKSYGVNVETTFKKFVDAEKYAIRCELPLSSIIPLYADPVDQTEEIERLRGALREDHATIEHDSTGKFKSAQNVINAALSGKDKP